MKVHWSTQELHFLGEKSEREENLQARERHLPRRQSNRADDYNLARILSTSPGE